MAGKGVDLGRLLAAATGYVNRYCSGIYNSSMLTNEQTQFIYKNRATVDADVKTCVSWFDIKEIRAQRKQAMRYCLTNNDYFPPAQRNRKAAYDACMNQNDTITALCTIELRVQVELMQALGTRAMKLPTCPGAGPESYGEEAMALRGGREDMGRPLVVAVPGLPPLLGAPLPKGLIRGGTPLTAQ